VDQLFSVADSFWSVAGGIIFTVGSGISGEGSDGSILISGREISSTVFPSTFLSIKDDNRCGKDFTLYHALLALEGLNNP
jgi:hypothetical protein